MSTPSSTYTIANLPRISNKELREHVMAEHPSMAIIDVRDSDYIGGHIKGCINVPSNTLDWQLPEIIRKNKDKEIVVFHCALSQQRGPSAALRYLRERDRLFPPAKEQGGGGVGENEETASTQKAQKVYVLDGGFVKWQEKYGEDKRLTEGYRKDIWEFGY